MRHGRGWILGILRSSLGYARDFACGLRRPQTGSTSTPPRSFLSLGIAQEDRGLGAWTELLNAIRCDHSSLETWGLAVA